ncbi:hypothetical protein [Plantactinospora sp. CA-290183]|uniref:hypothetical protein n=1 Tax=Plantactinospora sp. CA-290183 TaxID=3240006 RepID=UPI003D8BC8A5
MDGETPAFDDLVDGFRRVLDMYLAEKVNPPKAKRSRRPTLQLSFTRLPTILREQFPNWADIAQMAARANGRDVEWSNGTDWRAAVASWSSFGDEARELLEYAGKNPDTEAIARRIAGALAGKPIPAWEYVTVDVSVPLTSVPLFDGWQLCSVDRANDPTLPMSYSTYLSEVWTPDSLHSQGFGALRRPKLAHSLDKTEPDAHELIWPLLTLNLLDLPAVRAFTAYLVEPGRSIITSPDALRGHLPSEVKSWHPQPQTLLPTKPQILAPAVAANLERFAAEIGSRLAKLRDGDLRILAHAAGHHLYLAYHQGPKQPELDSSYVAFRRIVTIEALLRGTDGDHESIGRKVSQRAAVLAGQDDDSRLALRELIKAAYGARSAFAHGNSRTRPMDHPLLTRTARVIIRRWLVLVALHGAKRVAALLDDALLSASVRDSLLREIAEHESRAGLQ